MNHADTRRRVIDITEARRRLTYDPETGTLADHNGPVGTVTRYGYVRVKLAAASCMAHRVAWALHYGVQPPEFIDHINGDKSDNRIANLRAATRAQNARNRKRHANSTTGVKGVYAEGKRFRAAVRVDGTLLYLGTFDDKSSAQAAYASAAKLHHAEFARTE